MSTTKDEHSEAVAGPVERPVRPKIDARWYCVNRDGLATLCLNEQDAREMATECDIDFPRGGPHRAVLMGDVAALRARLLELEAAHEDASGAVLTERERCARLCLEKPGYFGSFANAELFAALIRDAAPEVPRHPHYPCRSDGRCQYAIDHGAEELGHCPRGKCVMPEGAHEVEPSCKTPAGCAENGCLGWCDEHKPEAAKP